MQRHLFFPRRRTEHWAHVSEAVRGPRCRAEQSSVYICMSSGAGGAGGPATCPWHLPLEASPPPANQKTCSPSPAPASCRRDPPSQSFLSAHLLHLLHLVPDPQMMAVQAEATATGGARFFTFAPPPRPPRRLYCHAARWAAGCRCTSVFTSAVRRCRVCGILMRSRLNQGGGHGSPPSQPRLTSNAGRSGTCDSYISVSPPRIGIKSGEGGSGEFQLTLMFGLSNNIHH